MLFLLTLFMSTVVTNAQSAMALDIGSKIALGQASPLMIQQAYATGAITAAEAQQLVLAFQTWLAQAAAAAEAALSAPTTNSAIANQCAATDAVVREKTPVIDGTLGYGANQCATLPAVYWEGETVSDTVPDLSGTYVNDNGVCPAVAAAGNQIRIEQRDEEIMFIGTGVVHHFKAERVGCPVTCSDIKNACVGQPAVGAPADCAIEAMATPNLDTDCWLLETAVGSVTWCKTDSGVSRQITGMGMQTFTAVDTRRRKQ